VGTDYADGWPVSRSTPHTLSLKIKSTGCYLIDTGNGLLAFDVGWPDTYREYKEELKRSGFRIEDIRWMMVSHFHIDHAGLAGMLQEKGIEFIVFRNQVHAIDEMERLIERKYLPYVKIVREAMRLQELSDSRSLLGAIGVNGEIIGTDGHGDQSVSLILDSGEAFIGDLPPEEMIGEYDERVTENWKRLRKLGARTIRPAHAAPYRIED